MRAHDDFLYTSAFTLLLPLAEKSPTDASVSLTLAATHVQGVRDPTLGLTDKLACFSVGLHHGEHCWLAVRQVFLHYLNVLCSLVKWHFLNLLCTLQFFYLCLVVFLSLINTTSLILSWLPFYSSDDSKSKGQLLINSEPCASSFAN